MTITYLYIVSDSYNQAMNDKSPTNFYEYNRGPYLSFATAVVMHVVLYQL